MHKKKIKVNPVDQVLQVLIYLIIIALCLIILLPCLNEVAYGSGRESSHWITSRKYSRMAVSQALMWSRSQEQ